MANAVSVTDVEPERADWLTVLDDNESTWRYARGNRVDPDTPAHVELRDDGSEPVLLRERDGTVRLRQDGPGLPEKIVVNVYRVERDAGVVSSGWATKVEYQQSDK